MTRYARPFFRSLLAGLAMTALVGAASAQASFGMKEPNEFGTYLAGQQALKDLETSDAARYFSEAAEADWDNPLLVERAFIAEAADGQIERAAGTARHLLELEPTNEMAKLVIATEAMKQRRFAAAVRELDDLGTDNYASITGVILKAWAYAGDGKHEEAFKLLDELGEEGLEEFLVFHRALMADLAGDTDQAIEYVKRAFDSDAKVARITEAYARILGNAARFDEAADVIARFESEGFTHPLVDEVKASIAKSQRPGMFAPNVQAGAAEMFYGIGIGLARDGGLDLAVVYLQLGHYLDPSVDVISLALGQMFDLAQRHEHANAIYDRIPATSPLKAVAIVRIAQNLDAMGDRPEALRRLGNIVQSRPDDLDAIAAYGDMLRIDDQFAAAADAYSKALALTGGKRPADWIFYYKRGMSLERDGRFEQGEPDFLKALEFNPDHPQVLNYLGYSWVDKGMNLDRALAMIEKAVAAAPNDGYIIDSLGWAFYRLGRYDEAVQTLETAVQLLPNEAELNDHLGDAYWRVGRLQEARFQWNIAAAVDDEGNVKERVQPKLAHGLDPLPEDQPVAAGQ